MDGWMDGWMDMVGGGWGLLDKWLVVWQDGWMDRLTGGWTDG